MCHMKPNVCFFDRILLGPYLRHIELVSLALRVDAGAGRVEALLAGELGDRRLKVLGVHFARVEAARGHCHDSAKRLGATQRGQQRFGQQVRPERVHGKSGLKALRSVATLVKQSAGIVDQSMNRSKHNTIIVSLNKKKREKKKINFN